MSTKRLIRRFLLAASSVVLLGGVIWFIGVVAILRDAAPSPIPLPPNPVAESLAADETAAPQLPPPPRPIASSPPARVIAESIDVDAPVITLGLDNRNIPEVPDDIWTKNTGGASARQVIAWYGFSEMPGQGDNAVFAAHVTWDKQPAVFSELTKLRAGDLIRVQTEAGDELRYEVSKNVVVDPNDPDSVRYLFSTGEEMLTLITCGGVFQADPSLPYGGSYTDRSVVQAKPLQGSVPTARAG
ncbi:MAG: sortase [Chloroflexi bacterium]|nr:sortase [Chloroflexota bacterium]